MSTREDLTDLSAAIEAVRARPDVTPVRCRHWCGEIVDLRDEDLPIPVIMRQCRCEPGWPMRLAEDEARARLATHDHGILCTMHRERGVDAVPVVYALVDDHVAVPIDTVKPKAGGLLQRERNLADDPRATLLIEHWDHDDWSQLWWVRAQLRWREDGGERREAELAARLAERFAQYRDQPFARLLVLEVAGLSGWTAGN